MVDVDVDVDDDDVVDVDVTCIALHAQGFIRLKVLMLLQDMHRSMITSTSLFSHSTIYMVVLIRSLRVVC